MFINAKLHISTEFSQYYAAFRMQEVMTSFYRQAFPQNTLSADQLALTNAKVSRENHTRCTRPTHIFLGNFRGGVFEFGGLKAIHAALSNWLDCFPGVWRGTLLQLTVESGRPVSAHFARRSLPIELKRFLANKPGFWRAAYYCIKTHATIFNVALVKLCLTVKIVIFLKICS